MAIIGLHGKPSQAAFKRLHAACKFIPEWHQHAIEQFKSRYFSLSAETDLIGSGALDVTIDHTKNSTISPETEQSAREILQQMQNNPEVQGDPQQIKTQLVLRAFDGLASHMQMHRNAPLTLLAEHMAGFKPGTDLHDWFLRETKRFNQQFQDIPDDKLGTIMLIPGQTYFIPESCLVNRDEESVVVSRQTRQQAKRWQNVSEAGPEVGGFYAADSRVNAVITREETTPVEQFFQSSTLVHESAHVLHQILFKKEPVQESELYQAATNASKNMRAGRGLARVFHPTHTNYILRSSPVENITIAYELIHSVHKDRFSRAVAQAEPLFWDAMQLLENFGK